MQVRSKPPILYNIAIEGEERQVEIDWGNTPNWLDIYDEDLKKAIRFSLVPKTPGAYPPVSVYLDGDKRPIIGSRVYGAASEKSGIAVEFRVHFIGWQRTIEKQVYASNGRPLQEGETNPNQQENIKVVHWVYPGGAIECSPKPTMVEQFKQHFIAMAKQQAQNKS